jgi:hypothetical protein
VVPWCDRIGSIVPAAAGAQHMHDRQYHRAVAAATAWVAVTL